MLDQANSNAPYQMDNGLRVIPGCMGRDDGPNAVR